MTAVGDPPRPAPGPPPAPAAAGLPVPQVDVTDPAAGYLTTMSTRRIELVERANEVRPRTWL
jgi:hypothetical protein